QRPLAPTTGVEKPIEKGDLVGAELAAPAIVTANLDLLCVSATNHRFFVQAAEPRQLANDRHRVRTELFVRRDDVARRIECCELRGDVRELFFDDHRAGTK